MINSLLGRGDTNKACVKSGPDGLSGAKVLNAIADDKSWILFSIIAMSSDSNAFHEIYFRKAKLSSH